MLNENERVMDCFANRKYGGGLPFFFPRLVDSAFPFIGAAKPMRSLDKRLFITRTSG